MDYNSLVLSIQSWANRNEPAFIAEIPEIINQAMAKINKEAKTIGFQKTVEGNMTVNVPNILKPSDYKQTISLQIIDPDTLSITFLEPRSYEYCVTYSPQFTHTDTPVFYSPDLDVPQQQIGAAYFYISPTPDKVYPYQLTYLSFPPRFDNANPKNFLTDRYPDLLLYACMVIAIPYLKSDERIPVYKSLYQEALDGVNNDTTGRYTDRLSKRDKD